MLPEERGEGGQERGEGEEGGGGERGGYLFLLGDGLLELKEEEEEHEDDDSSEDPESERWERRYLRAVCRSLPLRGGEGLGGGVPNTHCFTLSSPAAGGAGPGSAGGATRRPSEEAGPGRLGGRSV